MSRGRCGRSWSGSSFRAPLHEPPVLPFGGALATAFIDTRNGPEKQARAVGYPQLFAANEQLLNRIFGGSAGSRCSLETIRFADYAKVVLRYANPGNRLEGRRIVFHLDCEKAFALGAQLVAS